MFPLLTVATVMVVAALAAVVPRPTAPSTNAEVATIAPAAVTFLLKSIRTPLLFVCARNEIVQSKSLVLKSHGKESQ
jgi:hypothetical protein